MRHDLDALAKAADVTRRTIERWRREGAPMPKASESLAEWVQRLGDWKQARRIDNRRKAREGAGAAGEGSDDWDVRNKRALAELREHKLAVERGEFLPRDQVVEQWTKRVFAVRTRLLALPRTLGSRCANMPPDLVEKEADAIVRDVLLEFVADGEHTPAGGEVT